MKLPERIVAALALHSSAAGRDLLADEPSAVLVAWNLPGGPPSLLYLGEPDEQLIEKLGGWTRGAGAYLLRQKQSIAVLSRLAEMGALLGGDPVKAEA